MDSNSLRSKALDKASVSLTLADQIGLRGYSILLYASLDQQWANGWTVMRPGSLEVIRVEAEALAQLYPEQH